MTAKHTPAAPVEPLQGGPIWPAITAPAQHEKVDADWVDPALPDFARMNALAREFGYSIALHGSMKRDVDLEAVPWIEDAADPDILVNHLCDAIGARRASGWETKPNGRIAINLQPDGWFKLIDLSVMPKASLSALPVDELSGLRVCRSD